MQGETPGLGLAPLRCGLADVEWKLSQETGVGEPLSVGSPSQEKAGG